MITITSLSSNTSIQSSANPQQSARITNDSSVDSRIRQLQYHSTIADNPMDLLYRSVLDKAYDALQSRIPERLKEEGVTDQLDVSPKATAQRIVDGITKLFGQYQTQNPNETSTDAHANFYEQIEKGVEQGFSEARGILVSLSVLNGETKQNVNLTYDLMRIYLQDFKTSG